MSQRVKTLTKMQVRMKRKDASCCICKLKCQEDSTLALALTYGILDRNLNCHPNEVLFMQGYGQLAGAALIVVSWHPGWEEVEEKRKYHQNGLKGVFKFFWGTP